jgi:hypothetical protein
MLIKKGVIDKESQYVKKGRITTRIQRWED